LDPTSPDAQAELARRHKSAATIVIGLLVATILLSVIAFLGRAYFREQDDPVLNIGVRIAVLILGLGAIVWRRTKFQTMRLQDITGLQGLSGLLRTLEKTTVQIALIATAITVTGFVATLVSGNDTYTYLASAIAVVVLVYCYPTKSSWRRALDRFSKPPA
jgi:hypothetical protein